jgi:hypothetical protein
MSKLAATNSQKTVSHLTFMLDVHTKDNYQTPLIEPLLRSPTLKTVKPPDTSSGPAFLNKLNLGKITSCGTRTEEVT